MQTKCYKMLDYIINDICNYNYEKKIILIEKYIEIMKLIVELEKSDK